MKYRAVQTMCDKKVTTLLSSQIQNSEGTAIYSDMIHEVLEAYISPKLKPLERVELLWEWVILLRMWRAWILKQKDYSLSNNFITTNTYYCIEINAYCLIQAIIQFREQNKPTLVLPWLLSSQPCERTFRMLRSTTTSHCGVVSFSILDLQNHFRRVESLSSTYLKLGNEFVFPRHCKAFKISDATSHIQISLPNNCEIENAVQLALHRAVTRALSYGLIKKSSRSFMPDLRVIHQSEVDINTTDICFEDDNNECFSTDTSTVIETNEELNDNTDNSHKVDNDLDRENGLKNIIQDLFMVSSGSLGVKTFTDVQINESPFVRVSDGKGNPAIIRKQTLL